MGMKKSEHITSLKAMIRQSEKDLAKMKELLSEIDVRLKQKPSRVKRVTGRKTTESDS